MSQISFSDLVNGTIPDASDFNDRFNALKNRINNGMEADNIATGAITSAKIGANAVDASKLDETDDYTWTGAHDFSGATLTGAAQINGMVGSYKNLVVARASATAVDVDADFIIVWDSNNRAKLLSAVNLTGAITSSGANGLDAGTEASGTWYYIWVIYNGSAAALLLSTSATAPTLPSGYTYKALVSAVRNDGSSNFVGFNDNGSLYVYSTGQALFSGTGAGISNINTETVAAATAGTNKLRMDGEGQHGWQFKLLTANTLYYGTSGTSWTSIDMAGFVPSSISDFAFGSLHQTGTTETIYIHGFHKNKL